MNGNYPAFQSRIQALAEKYTSRNALIGRWERGEEGVGINAR